jgi:hypothetical protein
MSRERLLTDCFVATASKLPAAKEESSSNHLVSTTPVIPIPAALTNTTKMVAV